MTESTIDHANLWNRTSAEFGELVSKYESGDNLYKTSIWKTALLYCNMKVINHVKFCTIFFKHLPLIFSPWNAESARSLSFILRNLNWEIFTSFNKCHQLTLAFNNVDLSFF